MKVVFLLLRCVAVMLVAAGLLGAALTGSIVAALFFVWITEPAFLSEDKQILLRSGLWLISSLLLVSLSWWARARLLPAGYTDRSFRLFPQPSPRTEDMIQRLFEFGFYAAAAALVWAASMSFGLARILIVLSAMIAMYIGMHVRILVHELGHLLAAKLLGFRECKLQVGVGALLWSHVFHNGLLFEWRASTRAGSMLALPRSKEWLRLRQLVFVLAGPIADASLIWLSYKVLVFAYGRLGAGLEYGAAGVVMIALFWWTVWSAISGAIPHRIEIGGRSMWTDGYWILQLLLGRPLLLTDWARGFDQTRALDLLQTEMETLPDLQPAVAAEASCSVASFQEQRARLSSKLLRPGGQIFL